MIGRIFNDEKVKTETNKGYLHKISSFQNNVPLETLKQDSDNLF